MELSQLETFLAVAEEHSFSRAAVRMHRTQPAVSQVIRKLEAAVGEKLFDRAARDGSLTAAGALLRDYALRGGRPVHSMNSRVWSEAGYN
jgi:DNA-binding transcriptional LysR family regulator